MNKIIKLNQLNQIINTLKKDKKTVVLVGGCFDLIHYGHFWFLKQAKQAGDILIVALESDNNVRRLKGKNRPLTQQKARAQILAGFTFVNYVLLLPEMKSDKDYQKLTKVLKPDIIAVTKGDKQLLNKQKFADLVSAELVTIPHINTPSTTDLLKYIKNNREDNIT